MTNLIKDTFTAKSFLPAHVSSDGMELIETTLQKTSSDCGTLFVEIGETIESTPASTRALLQESFPELLEMAIEEGCEYIQFSI